VHRGPLTGPRGGRISTAVLREATHWDEVGIKLGYKYFRLDDLRHTGLTWMGRCRRAGACPAKDAGQGQITTTQRCLNPNRQSIQNAGTLLSAHLALGAQAMHTENHDLLLWMYDNVLREAIRHDIYAER
jgi:hypothetical protein